MNQDAEYPGQFAEGLATLFAEDGAKSSAKLYKCGTEPERTKISGKANGDMNIEVSTFEDCPQNPPVALYSVEGGGNTCPGGEQNMAEDRVCKTSNDFSANEVIWSSW